jgi:hypothetical protein
MRARVVRTASGTHQSVTGRLTSTARHWTFLLSVRAVGRDDSGGTETSHSARFITVSPSQVGGEGSGTIGRGCRVKGQNRVHKRTTDRPLRRIQLLPHARAQSCNAGHVNHHSFLCAFASLRETSSPGHAHWPWHVSGCLINSRQQPANPAGPFNSGAANFRKFLRSKTAFPLFCGDTPGILGDISRCTSRLDNPPDP